MNNPRDIRKKEKKEKARERERERDQGGCQGDISVQVSCTETIVTKASDNHTCETHVTGVYTPTPHIVDSQSLSLELNRSDH